MKLMALRAINRCVCNMPNRMGRGEGEGGSSIFHSSHVLLFLSDIRTFSLFSFSFYVVLLEEKICNFVCVCGWVCGCVGVYRHVIFDPHWTTVHYNGVTERSS